MPGINKSLCRKCLVSGNLYVASASYQGIALAMPKVLIIKPLQGLGGGSNKFTHS